MNTHGADIFDPVLSKPIPTHAIFAVTLLVLYSFTPGFGRWPNCAHRHPDHTNPAEQITSCLWYMKLGLDRRRNAFEGGRGRVLDLLTLDESTANR